MCSLALPAGESEHIKYVSNQLWNNGEWAVCVYVLEKSYDTLENEPECSS